MANDFSAVIPDLWSLQVMAGIRKRLVMAGIIDKTFMAPEITRRGDAVYIPIPFTVTSSTKTQGTDISAQDVTPTVATINVDTHKTFLITLEEVDRIQSSPDALQMILEEGGYSLAAAAEASCVALYSHIPTGYQITATSGTVKSDFLTAIKYLNAAGAPMTDRWAVVSAEYYYLLQNTSEFTLYNYTGDIAGIREGDIGRLFGVNVVMSPHITGSTTHNLVFHKDAFAFILSKSAGARIIPNAAAVGDDVVGSILYGCGCVRGGSGFAVDIQYTP